MDNEDFAYTHKPSYEEIDSYSGVDEAFHIFTDYRYGQFDMPFGDLVPGDTIWVTDDMEVWSENEFYLTDDSPKLRGYLDFSTYRNLRSSFEVLYTFTTWETVKVEDGYDQKRISCIELTLGDEYVDDYGETQRRGYVTLKVNPENLIRVEPNEPQMLDPLNLKPIRNWVNVYGVDRVYGGPEEGGWYYNTYDPLFSVPCNSYDLACEIADQLSEKFPETGNSSLVLGGADFTILIENQRGEYRPKNRPYYS